MFEHNDSVSGRHPCLNYPRTRFSTESKEIIQSQLFIQLNADRQSEILQMPQFVYDEASGVWSLAESRSSDRAAALRIENTKQTWNEKQQAQTH